MSRYGVQGPGMGQVYGVRVGLRLKAWCQGNYGFEQSQLRGCSPRTRAIISKAAMLYILVAALQ